MPISDTHEKAKRSGKRFIVRFQGEADYEKVKRAAKKLQAPMRKEMSRYFPNVSLFVVEAAIEKAERILSEGK
jgi:uncharacterized protein (DUF1778 family)